VDGDFRLFESGAIAEYLCERHIDSGLGRIEGDPERYVWLQWIHYCETMAVHTAALVQQRFFIAAADRSPMIAKLEGRRLEKSVQVLEAQLIDHTDEIAYITADLDDGLESNLITLKAIREHVPLFEHYYGEVERLYPAAIEKLKFNEALKRMLDHLVGDLIRNTKSNVAPAKIKTLTDVRNSPKRLADFSGEVEAQRKQAKEFLYAQLYYSPELKRDKEQSARVITEMFNFWLAHPDKLPATYRQEIDSGSSSPARVVCDYVAGMTDNFILEQHRIHCGGALAASDHE